MKPINLSSLQNGVVLDMFNEEFGKVMRNIADNNVKPDAVREITIKVSIKPDKTRQSATTRVDVSSKLAPVKSTDGMMFIGFDENNEPAAYEDNFNQPELDAENAPSIFKMAGQAARS